MPSVAPVAPTMAPTQGRTRPKSNKTEKKDKDKNEKKDKDKNEKKDKKDKAQTNRLLYEEKAEVFCEEEMIIGVRINRIRFRCIVCPALVN